MKKKLALLLALVMVCATMLTACGGSKKSKYEGTWEMTSAMSAGVEAIDTMKDMGVDLSFVFEGDKVKVMTGGKETAKADWKEDGDKIVITEGEQELELTVADGKLTTEQAGATLTFEKK